MEIAAKIIDLRARCARGEPVTDDELREVIQAIRVSRTAVQTTTNKKKAAATPISNDQLMSLFDEDPKNGD